MRKRNQWISLVLALLLLAGCAAPVQREDTEQETGSAAAEQTEEPVELTVPEAYTYTGSYDYTRALASRNQVSRPGDAELTAVGSDLPRENRDYTVMVYMIGSNLESQMGSGTKDLMEMEQAGVDYSKSNVLVYTGGSVRWMGRVPNDRNCVLDLSKQKDRIVAQTEGNADMGASDTLASFVNFCCEQYPADHYALILWDHGGGPLWGYGSDELYQSDSLLLSEMTAAMKSTPFSGDRKLDWVGFDACLMGSLECMALWQDYADYYVASEELEPGDGWDYSFLRTLNDTTDPVEVTISAVDCFGAYYESLKSQVYHPDVTLSCVDLGQVGELLNTVDTLSGKLSHTVSGGDYAKVQKIRSEAKSFGLVEGAKGEEPYSYDLMDLGDFAKGLSDLLPQESQNQLAALDQLVVKEYSNVDAASGVSIYYPFRNKGQYAEMASVYQEVGVSGYVRFLNALTGPWLSGETRDWTPGQLPLRGEEYLFQLTEEQQNNVTNAYYTVLIPMQEGGYTPIFMRNRIEPDGEGVLHIPVDPKVICLSTDSGDSSLCPAVQLETGKNRSVYRTERTRLVPESNFFYEFGMYDADLLDISVVIAQNGNTGELQVQTVNAVSGDAAFGGKNTVNADHYEGIYYSSHAFLPVRDRDGRMRLFTQWIEDNDGYLSTLTMDHHFGFELRPVSEMEQGAIIQVELEDSSGTFYASELAEVQSEQAWREVKETTGQGEIIYHVYENHAELYEYTGLDEELTIPETIEGVEVTEIGDGAFGRMTNHQGNGHFVRITLPDTIETIGSSAFQGCLQMEEITLPKDLKTIGAEAFCGCSSLKGIQVPEGVTAVGKNAFSQCYRLERLDLPGTLRVLEDGVAADCPALGEITLSGSDDGTCEGCRIQDNVVFSSDGGRLIAFPAAREGAYTVPEGTEVIAYAAFSQTKLSRITFPNTLTEIRNCAFRACDQLQVPVFPENLTSIGHHAFGAANNGLEWTDQVLEQQEIRLGAKVSFIGAGAFDAFMGRRFTVDEGNPWYSDVDGALCNGEGDVCLACASTGQPVVVIPEGVTRFEWDMLHFVGYRDFFSNYRFTALDVVLPDSVTSFSDYDSDFDDLVVFHCAHGSPAERYAKEHNIPCDDHTQFSYQITEQPTAHGTARYFIYDDHAQLVRYEGTDARLEVPEQVEGQPVTVIGDGQSPIQVVETSFDLEHEEPELPEGEAKRLHQVLLPDTVKELNNKAFQYCTDLEEVNLPEGLQIIGDQALDVSFRFKMDHLPASAEYVGSESLTGWEGTFTLTPAMTYLAPNAFGTSSHVTDFAMDGNNEQYSVRDGLLYDRAGETLLAVPAVDGTLTVPDGTKQIGDNALAYQWKMTRAILPDSVTEIGENAFRSSGLTAMPSSKHLELIDQYAFYGCDGLTEAVMPSSLKKIRSNAFANCKNLSKVSFAEGLESIGEYAFGSCPLVIDVKLPDSLIAVDQYAFGDYSQPVREGQAAEIAIGSNLIYMGYNAFGSIPAQRYTVAEDNPKFAAAEGMLTDKNGNVLLACPAGISGSVSVPEGIVYIQHFAFDNGNGITDLTVPDSVLAIGSTAFRAQYTSDDNGQYTRSYALTLHCHQGTYCQQFAMETGIPCVAE